MVNISSTCPLVTVIVPFFNRKRFLPFTIRSILRQSHSNLQLILLDDGSTDGSSSVARSFPDHRLQMVRFSRRRGKATVVNKALPLARGKYVNIFDSDDLMTPHSLARRIGFLCRSRSSLAVMGRIGRLIGPQGRPLPEGHPLSQPLDEAVRVKRQMARTLGGLIPELFAFGRCPISPLSLTLLRRRTMDRVGRFNEAFAVSEDKEFLLRLSALQPIPFLDVSCMWYRVHADNLSFRVAGSRLKIHPRYRSLDERLQQMYQEVRRAFSATAKTETPNGKSTRRRRASSSLSKRSRIPFSAGGSALRSEVGTFAAPFSR